MSKQLTIPSGDEVTNRQQASFLNRIMELHKRFKDGTVSPEFTLQGIQDLIEGKYVTKTKFGTLKLFGPTIEVYDHQIPYGFGPEELFKNIYADFSEIMTEKEELIPLFKFKQGVFPDSVKIAPYCFPKTLKISEILNQVNSYGLCPSITLGHIDNTLTRYANGLDMNDVLFTGNGGNYFLIRDINGTPWFVWIFLHSSGSWCYKFMNTNEYLENVLHPGARLWLLLPPQSKLMNVTLKEDETLQLTTSNEEGRTCVYVSVENGKLVLAGGSSMVKRIEGAGYKSKIVGK